MKITATFWLAGFVIIGATRYFVDANDLLINHSKGVYGPDDRK